VVALYQLADQYQVQSALMGLQAVAKQTSFTVEDLKLLMPTAAALGDTAAQLRAIFAQHAARLVGRFLKQPDAIKQWGLLELELVMQYSHHVCMYEGLVLAAAWIEGSCERVQHWEQLRGKVQLHRITYHQLTLLQENQSVLGLPGMGAALFNDCMRRITNNVDNVRLRGKYYSCPFD
jgi:hypothetical protein